MSPRFTLYGCPNTRSLRAAWALEEAGVPYDYVRINLFKGEGRKPPLIELNSSGKVPVLRDGDMILTESAAIITHLGERFLDGDGVDLAKEGIDERLAGNLDIAGARYVAVQISAAHVVHELRLYVGPHADGTRSA